MNALRFLLQTIGIGVIAGLVLVVAYPRLLEPSAPPAPNPLPAPSESAPVLAPTRIAEPPQSFADAVQIAAPAVVNIYSTRVIRQRTNPFFDDPFFRRFFGNSPLFAPQERRQSSLGSGVVTSPEGYLLTNNHVISGADEIRVALQDGRTELAALVGTDPDTDLAVLKVEIGDLPVIPFGRSSEAAVGDLVLAIGNPFGVGQTVTMGIISATGRQNLGINTYENFIQTDAAINPGNSGGALVSTTGALLGINTAIYSRSGGSQGIGFAVPTELAQKVLEDIVEHGRVIRGWLGIQVQDIRPDVAETLGLTGQRGVVVTGIGRGSPADKGSLRQGDIITRIDGVPIATGYETLNQIAALAPGKEIDLEILRGTQARAVRLTVVERPRRENDQSGGGSGR